MKARPFYVLACALAVVAIVVSCASVIKARRALESAARAAEADSPDDRVALHSTALLHARQSDRHYLAGAVLFVVALGGWVTSRFRQEGGLLIIPLLLMFVAGIFQLLLV